MNLLQKYSTGKDDLNYKLSKFVDHYLADPNASRAAIAAGFPAAKARRIGQNILSRPKVQAYLQQQKAELAERNAISRDYIISQMMEIHRRSMQLQPILDREGEPTGLYKFDGKTALAALREISDLMGYYQQQQVDQGIIVQVRQSFDAARPAQLDEQQKRDEQQKQQKRNDLDLVEDAEISEGGEEIA